MKTCNKLSVAGVGVLLVFLTAGCATQGTASTPSVNVTIRSSNTIFNTPQNSIDQNGTIPANNTSVSSPPLAPPQIMSTNPPISGGVITCTNYFNAPAWNIVVIAGSNPATPHRGELIVESGSLSKTITLPSGDGIPKLTGFNRRSVTFTTSTGASGTLDYKTGTLNMNQ